MNDMGGTIFTDTPSGITRAVSDNTTFAASTAFVKSFISTYLVPLSSSVYNLTLPTVGFTSVYTRLLSFSTAPTMRGTVSIGGSSTIIKILNNTIPIDANYPYILSSDATNSQRIQAGYYTTTGPVISITTPKSPAGTVNAYATSSINTPCAATTTTAVGFGIYTSSTAINEFYWLMFQTN